MPEVSVIMTVKNGLPYIAQTIASVLAQRFRDFEFVIIDDGSTDQTAEVVQRFEDERIRFFQQANTGIAPAKNLAIGKSSGNYIAIIDADDIWMPDKLEKQVSFLNKNKGYVAVGGFAAIIDKDGNYLYTEKKPVTDAEIRTQQEFRNPWTHSAVMYTRTAFDAVGGYYEPVKHYIVDYMLMYQLSLHGKVYQLPMVVVKYRIVPTATSAKQNSKTFDEIAHRAIRAGHMSAQDLADMAALKTKEQTPDFKWSMYHLYLGRSFLFHNYNRKKSLQHLNEALKFHPQLNIARVYMLMAWMLPEFLVKFIYQKLSPIAGSTQVDENI